MTVYRRYLISGRVQGVFFRANTRQQAQALGITGFAKNLVDGRVEVVACGEEGAIEQLDAWLRQGPPDAVVEEVRVESIADRVFEGFVIG